MGAASSSRACSRAPSRQGSVIHSNRSDASTTSSTILPGQPVHVSGKYAGTPTALVPLESIPAMSGSGSVKPAASGAPQQQVEAIVPSPGDEEKAQQLLVLEDVGENGGERENGDDTHRSDVSKMSEGGAKKVVVVEPSPRTAFAANPVEWKPPEDFFSDHEEEKDIEGGGGTVWEWAEGDEDDDGDGSMEWDEAQDLIARIREAARQQGGELLKLLEAQSKDGVLDCHAFCRALVEWPLLAKKRGLVERAGPTLFESLSRGSDEVEVREATDFLSVNSRGNPLRAATSRKGTTGGKMKEMERAERAAAAEIEKMRVGRKFLLDEVTKAHIEEQHRVADLQALAEEFKTTKTPADAKVIEKKAVDCRKILLKAQTALSEASKALESNDVRMEGMQRWRDHVVQELEEEKSFVANREMGLRDMERLLRRKEEERQALREEAWARGARDPERWAEPMPGTSPMQQAQLQGTKASRGEDSDAEEGCGATGEREGAALLREIALKRSEVTAIHSLLLPHAITAFRKVEISHDQVGGRVGELEQRLEELQDADMQRQETMLRLKDAQELAHSLQDEVDALRLKIASLEGDKEDLKQEVAKTKQALVDVTGEFKDAHQQKLEAIDHLAHAEGLMSGLNAENVRRRTEAFHAVQAEKEAREIVKELEALRKKEEHKWLQVQEEQTKAKSQALDIRVKDFAANKLGRLPSGPRVFLSSSQSDFVKERDEIKKFAMPSLQQDCAQRGLMIQLVDLRYGIGDADTAVGRIMPMIVAEIDRCQYFTCFLGQQTGAFPQNFSNQSAGNSKRSQAKEFYQQTCTEMEAEYILENKLAWGQRAFFYIRDERSADDIHAVMDVPPTEGMNDSMRALKQRIFSSGLKCVVDYMSARDGVTAWRNDVLMMIKKDYVLDGNEFDHVQSGVDGWRPRSFMEQVEDNGHQAAFENRTATYVRTSETEKAVAAIRLHVGLQGGNPLFLTGPPGCGKATAMAVYMAQFRREMASDQKALITGFSTRTIRTNPVNLLRSMMRTIKTHFQVDSPSLPEGEQEVLSHGALFSWLEIGGLEAQVLFCLDLDGFHKEPWSNEAYVKKKLGGEEMKAEEGLAGGGHGNLKGPWLGGDGCDMRWLTSAQPAGVNLIVSGSHPETVKTAKEVYFWPHHEMNVMSREDSEAIVDQYLGSRGQVLDGKRKEQFWSLRTQEVSSPMFLHLVLCEWSILDTVGWKHDMHIERVLMIQAKDQSKSIGLLFRLMLDRWEEELEESNIAIFGPILSNLVLSRAGLTEMEIIDLTGLRNSFFNSFISIMREFLSSKSGALNLTSQILVQNVVQRYLMEASEVQAARCAIIDYFREKGYGNERSCYELPYQMRLAGQTKELGEAITVLGVFRCFLSSGLETELLSYWRIFTSEAKEIAEVYQKGLQRLEADAKEGMVAKEQLAKYGVSLEGLEAMADLLSQLGRFLARSGQNLACIKMLERLVDVQGRLHPNSSQLASAAHRLAKQCWSIAYFEQGLPYVKQCIALQEKLNGRESLEVSESSQLLAMTLFGLGLLEDAEKAMYTSLKIRESIVGKDHPSVAEALLGMGKILLRLGKTEEARDYQLRANKLMGARSRKSIRQQKDADMPAREGDK